MSQMLLDKARARTHSRKSWFGSKVASDKSSNLSCNDQYFTSNDKIVLTGEQQNELANL